MQQQCVIKGCKKNGAARLIHSDDTNYGWFCRDHWNEIFNKNYIYLEGEGYNITIPHERYSDIICLSCSRGEPCGICGYIKNNKSQKWNYELGTKHSNLIRTVIFPTGKLKYLTKESLAKELDLFLYNNKITRDQIITIQYVIGGGGGMSASIFHNIMLVYEIKQESREEE